MRLFWYSSCSSMKLYFKYTCCLFIVRSTWRLNSFTLQFHAFLQVLKFLYHISKNLWYLDFQSDSNEGSQVKKAYDSLDRLHDDGIWYSKCLLCLFLIQSWNWSPLTWGQVLFSSFIQFTCIMVHRIYVLLLEFFTVRLHNASYMIHVLYIEWREIYTVRNSYFWYFCAFEKVFR